MRQKQFERRYRGDVANKDIVAEQLGDEALKSDFFFAH